MSKPANLIFSQETHEKYFYGSEHWNYFTNDEVNVCVASGLRALSNNL